MGFCTTRHVVIMANVTQKNHKHFMQNKYTEAQRLELEVSVYAHVHMLVLLAEYFYF